jgi:tRNA(adenine34) deaminase
MALSHLSNEYFMKEALKEAEIALVKDEVPIGAVIVCKNKIIARAHNLTETLSDATAHAEMQAITAAASFLGVKYLNECTLYVTLEPCFMCAGACYWSQLGNIIYGASDEKRGYRKIKTPVLHTKTRVLGGILENQCSIILKRYFKSKR